MKLPPHLFSKYRQYKNDSGSVVEWIVTSYNNLQQAIQNNNSSRNKKKKGKGKKGTNNNNKNNNNNTPTKCNGEPSLSELLEMTQFIKQKQITPPEWVLILLQKIISNRNKCANFYIAIQNQSDINANNNANNIINNNKNNNNSNNEKNNDVYKDELNKSNVSHKHTLEVFRTIYIELGGEEYQQRRKELFTNKEENEKDEERLLRNRFEGLEIQDNNNSEEENDLDDWMPDYLKKKPKKSKKHSVITKYGVKDDDSSESFAIWCFFCDLANIRLFIEEQWQRFHNSEISILSLSFITTYALKIANQLENEMKLIVPQFNYQKFIVMKAIWVEWTDNDFISLFMPDVYQSAISFADVIVDGNAPVVKEGFFGIFDESKDYFQLAVKEQIEEDRMILCYNYPEWVLYAKISDNFDAYLSKDIFSIVNQFVDTKETTMTFMFLSKLFLSSLNLSRGKLNSIYQSMNDLGTKLSNSVKKYINLQVTDIDPKLAGQYSLTNRHLKMLEEQITIQLVSDVALSFRQKMKMAGYVDQIQENKIFRQNPWFCGIQMYEAIFNFHHVAVQVVIGDGFFIAICHLYNYLNSIGALESIPLFERLVSLYEEKVFSGSRPKSKFSNAVCLSLGVRAESFAQNKHSTSVRSNSHGRGFTTQDTSMFFRIYRDDFQYKDLISYNNANNLSNCEYMDLEMENTLNQILNIAQYEVQTKRIGINLLEVNLMCVKLLRSIRSKLSDFLIRVYGNEYLEYENQLPFIVGYLIFHLEKSVNVDHILAMIADCFLTLNPNEFDLFFI